MKNRQKLALDLEASLDQIAEAVSSFHSGKIAMYRTVAVQLRLLLTKSDPLIKKIFKSSAFHPLRGTRIDAKDSNLVFSSPALTEFSNGKAKIKELFNKKGKPLVLDAWLNQPLLNAQITIRELIDSVAGKEGAHADNDYNNTLAFTNNIQLGLDPLRPQYVIAIGEYAESTLREIISQLSDEFIEWRRRTN